ncbi:PilT/PilU family type 4a pilus ATPase [Schumannella soli]|uniref:PilT/PilU family type 4a pilus ATPase n=2 Tax=Schumannella soli TaxID=2590779 RepID=A0A506XQB8_9MICO|nr:PilT/PilU family type 4a pilus ATPase [Schumannella soli]
MPAAGATPGSFPAPAAGAAFDFEAAPPPAGRVFDLVDAPAPTVPATDAPAPVFDLSDVAAPASETPFDAPAPASAPVLDLDAPDFGGADFSFESFGSPDAAPVSVDDPAAPAGAPLDLDAAFFASASAPSAPEAAGSAHDLAAPLAADAETEAASVLDLGAPESLAPTAPAIDLDSVLSAPAPTDSAFAPAAAAAPVFDAPAAAAEPTPTPTAAFDAPAPDAFSAISFDDVADPATVAYDFPTAPVGTAEAPAPTQLLDTVAAPDAPADVAPSAAEIDEIAALNPGAGSPDPDLIAALQQVLLTGASDLHIASGAAPMLRVDGGLSPIPGYDVWDRAVVRERLFSLLSEDYQKKFDEALELDFAYTLSANARFRVNFYQDRGSMGAAFRIIPTHIKTLRELGIGEEVGSFSTLPRGLVLVTGPTGSGKSTTLAAMIDLVNETRRDHVVTVEDPIEFMHKNKKSLINQREVGRDTHSFGNALKHVLRQDPDVILIGELRDLETISIALTAAETGHLVFATLHTQSAPTTIDRVIDVFPPHQQDQVRTQLAATLQGVVCQTLVKKAGGSGRAVATEVMFTTPAISNLVREGKTYQITSVLQSGASQGMHTMDQALAQLVNDGTITRSVAMEKSQDPETLERLITRVDMNQAGGDGGFVSLDFNDYGDQKGRH